MQKKPINHKQRDELIARNLGARPGPHWIDKFFDAIIRFADTGYGLFTIYFLLFIYAISSLVGLYVMGKGVMYVISSMVQFFG